MKEKDFPINFDKFLEVMLALCEHPSHMLCSFALGFWKQVLEHDILHEVIIYTTLHLSCNR